ncbi:calcium-binding protein [Carnobacterium divergens]|uniref:calcium-binding protein n=1 Tax=Carnobacterium divergens TaxID=2748 RepID=UPI001072697B|nr:calcium-binding protein [Carnobacterium divergens]
MVFDLDGDGIETKDIANGAYFDVDNDGKAEKVGWINSDDGILVYDKNQDGQINNGNEIFGDGTMLASGEFAKDGYEALAEYDENGDGQITESDSIFDKLRIWRDLSGDGKSSIDELFTLRELNIKSIHLGYSLKNKDLGNGNILQSTGTYEKTDGTVLGTGTILLETSQMNTEELEKIDLSDHVLDLPELANRGDLNSLRKEMMLTKDLEKLVLLFIQQGDPTQRKKIMENLLYTWAKVEGVDSNSRGSYVDAKKLAFLEKYMGRKFIGINGLNPNNTAGPEINYLFEKLKTVLYKEMMLQSVARTYIQFGIMLDGWEKVGQYLETLATEKERYWHLEDIIDTFGLKNNTERGYNQFIKTYVENNSNFFDMIYQNVKNSIVGSFEADFLEGTYNADILSGRTGNDLLQAGSGNDVLIGGSGNDQLEGGGGNDTYIFGVGDGQDIIKDDYGTDKIQFLEGIREEDVEFVLLYDEAGKRTNDAEIRIKGTTDTILIKNQIGSGAIEEIEFANGKIWNSERIKKALSEVKGTNASDVLRAYYENSELYGYAGDDKLYGSSGADTFYGGRGNDEIHGESGNDLLYGEEGDDQLYGGYGNDSLLGGSGNDNLYGESGDDTLEGGTGNDYLSGGYGNDIYRFSKGDGQDIIEDDYGTDKIQFLEGIREEDVEFVLLYDEAGKRTNDAEIRIKGTTDTILIKNQIGSGAIEEIEFANGKIWNSERIKKALSEVKGTNASDVLRAYYENSELYGYAGDDKLYGSSGADTFYGGRGNDEIHGESGNDLLYGEEGDDQLYGGYENDSLLGGSGNDHLYGESGDDTLEGGTGNDYLSGGYGNDIYRFSKGDGQDIIEDAYGNDTLIIESKYSDLIFIKQDQQLKIDYSNSDSIMVNSWFSSSSKQIESIQTTDGYILDTSKMNQLITKIAEFSDSKGMTSFTTIEKNAKEYQEILNQFWAK